MSNFVISRKNIVAFGQDIEDAEYEWKMRYYMHYPEEINSSEYAIRVLQLHPWRPTSKHLQISSVGCLKSVNNLIVETASGKSVLITQKKYSIFQYIMSLLGNKVTYEDIVVVLRENLNAFFREISKEFVPIEEYPQILCINEDNGFDPGVTYTLGENAVVGISNEYVGIKVKGYEYFYAVELNNEAYEAALIAYIAYRAGMVFNDEGEVLYVKKS